LNGQDVHLNAPGLRKEEIMKIAVINETSAADKNADILAALEGRGHEIISPLLSWMCFTMEQKWAYFLMQNLAKFD